MTACYQHNALPGADACPHRHVAMRRRLLIALFAVPLIVVIGLLGGFLWFTFQVARQETARDGMADGIVALTGGASRINDAIELLASGRGPRLRSGSS